MYEGVVMTDHEQIIYQQLGDQLGLAPTQHRVGKLVNALIKHLAQDERVVAVAAIEQQRKVRLVAMTNQRVMLVDAATFGSKITTYHYDAIVGLVVKPQTTISTMVLTTGEHVELDGVYPASQLAALQSYLQERI
jgi:hypothetical protein